MVRERRSRKRLQPGTRCYLCEREVRLEEKWNRDHVPPERFYGKSIRTTHNPQLQWLPTHVNCNSAFKADEELFCTSFAIIATGSQTADAVVDDLRRAFRKGHWPGLGKTVLAQFGKVALPDGSLIYRYDPPRTARVVWKIARGVFALEDGRILPENTRHRVFPMLGPWRVEEQAQASVPWLRAVLDTEPMADHGAVLM